MKTVIPFVAQTHERDRQTWIDKLGAAMPDCVIKEFGTLGAQERAAATVAIVMLTTMETRTTRTRPGPTLALTTTTSIGR